MYKIGKELLEDSFIGVFPLDKIPQYFNCGGYVVNTQTSNLPGEHWIAFNVKPHSIDVFDPFGIYYPSALVSRVLRSGKTVNFSRKKCQYILTNNCGHLCLLWLMLQYL